MRADGRYVSLKMNWQATVPVAISYKVYVHLYNLDGELVAQNDQYPVGEFLPTNQWTPGKIVSDGHGLVLPEPAKPGYRLEIGWYDPASGQRLPIAGSTEDAFEIMIH
jgi:hypothetical protein